MEQMMEAAASGIGSVDWKLETMHGKNVCDPLSNMPARTLRAAIELGHMLLPGTREKFTSLNVPTAVGFKDSHECHLFAGLGRDADAARLDGPITVRGNVSACKPCTAGNFNSCEMLAVSGPVRNVKVPRADRSALRQMDSLHLFSVSCKKGQLAATRVVGGETCLEGLYYLAGDLVVRISYYKLIRPDVEGGFRSYELLEGKQRERKIHVNSLIRLHGLKFSPGPGGPAGRLPRSADGVAKFYYLSRDTDNNIQ
eukprot:3236290-Prymnesium_polylepis.1